MSSNVIQVIDCLWNRPNAVEEYTHLRLYENGVKSHQYKRTFGRGSTGGSTGWKFYLDEKTTWSIEVYSSAHHAPLTRRISMNEEEYERRVLKDENFDKSRSVEADNSSPSKEPVLAYDVKMAFGTITLHIVKPRLSEHLHNINELIMNTPLLQRIEKLEPILDRISRVGDVISVIHPVIRGIMVIDSRHIQELKNTRRMHKEIYALAEDMCHMLDHLEKIKPCMDQQFPGGAGDESLNRVLSKIEAVMKDTCELFSKISEDSRRKRATSFSILSDEQNVKRLQLQTQYVSLKAELGFVLTVDIFVTVKMQNPGTIPKSRSVNNLHREFADPCGVKLKPEVTHIESVCVY
ncbi:hypothetical protein K435DRAFT_962687 [Dendrothele bispora CBS 962.96]|uniref:Uncharacterized protein n=1 Tax=Dendrothele bispora (strain CBS 962.96) TaxID=1314807 RepID=A0A4S8MK23_DENBC|nr:hypothetical protein K435DRAFT_962687 [Dendrothele bispora CBS 962.96]